MYRTINQWLPALCLALLFTFSSAPAFAGFFDDLAAQDPPKRAAESPEERIAIYNAQDAIPAVNPFAPVLDTALKYFAPMEGKVLSVQGETIEVELGEGKTAIEGMRMRMYRKGDPFLHPVTKQVIVKGESPVGVAEVTAAAGGTAFLRLVEGEAAVGDVARISSGRIRAFFYQGASVDWDAAEEYYFWLRDSGRFAIAETPPGNASTEEISSMAREWDADVAIIVQAVGTPAKPMLRQTLMWVEGASVFSIEETPIKADELSTLKVGREYFAPDRGKPTIVFKVPFTATLIASGNIDGIGEQELLLADGSLLHFMSAGASLVPAFGSRDDVVIKGETGQVPLWLEVVDLDLDGKDEVLLTVLRGIRPMSFIYDYKGGEFTKLWEGKGFIRAIGNTVYIQHGDPEGGFTGSPAPLDWQGSAQAGALLKHIPLPDGLNIYNLAILEEKGQPLKLATFDRKGHLTILSDSGLQQWVSKDLYSPFNRSFARTTIAEEDEQETWDLNDRLVGIGEGIYTFRRIAHKMNVNVKGLGHSKTAFMVIFPSSEGIRETTLVEDMRAGSLDFTIAGNKLYVLAKSFIPNPMNLFKGKKVFSSKLTVYLLGGKKQ
ncbi:MAG: hypothetical protein KAR83_01175 [Thermodesulfovibrionales bacterium]|nr:hypothetical protein [Thermodesulfovibrionales bacterium]